MDTISIQPTNFNQTATIQQFDATLGTLTDIVVELTGTVEGTANAESSDASPTTVTLVLGADVELTRPDGTVLLGVEALASSNATGAGLLGGAQKRRKNKLNA